MNCCNDYGECKQGHGCPARSEKFWLEEEDKPIVTLDGVFVWIRDILAVIGMAFLAVTIGLHSAGFFDWLWKLKG